MFLYMFIYIGLDNAGKTTIVKKLAGEDIDEVSPTLGFSIKSLSFRDYRLNIWDIGMYDLDDMIVGVVCPILALTHTTQLTPVLL